MNRKTGSFAYTLSALLALAGIALPCLAGDGMPSLLTTRLAHIDKTYPTWVSAAAAARPDGSLDPGLFHPYLWEKLQNLLTPPVDPVQGCVPVSEIFVDPLSPPDTSSLSSAFRSSALVVRARVADREFGFDRGDPGQLFKVEVLETFKGADPRLAAYYFFVPVGRFKAGNLEICKTDYRFPNVPRIGDEVILMIRDVAADDPFLEVAFENQLIVLQGDKVLLPRRLAGVSAGSTRPSLLGDLSRLASEGRQ